jgi:hypothetical protein
MKGLLFFSATALILVGAAPSDHMRGHHGIRIVNGYPPCSRTVQDRCIQLYERGVATAANLALNERLGPGRSWTAMGGPLEPVQGSDVAPAAAPAPADNWGMPAKPGSYPPCSATVTDRCDQMMRHHKPAKPAGNWEPVLGERG